MSVTSVRELISQLEILEASDETLDTLHNMLDDRIKAAWKNLTNEECSHVAEATSLLYIAGDFNSDAEEDSCSDSIESLTLEELLVPDTSAGVRVADINCPAKTEMAKYYDSRKITYL